MDARRESAGDARRRPDVVWPVQQTSSSRCRVIRGNRHAAHPHRSCDGSVSSACRCIWTDRPFQGADPPIGAPWAFMGGSQHADSLPGRCCMCMRDGADGRSVVASTRRGRPREQCSGPPLSVACRSRHIQSASVCCADGIRRRDSNGPSCARRWFPSSMSLLVSWRPFSRWSPPIRRVHATWGRRSRSMLRGTSPRSALPDTPCDVRPFANEHNGRPRSPMPDGYGRVNTHG
jgi:hypothetical protein